MMANESETMMSMTPEKERELTSKILERAEIAQMTRQLKIGLNKVSTNKAVKSNTGTNKMGVFLPRKDTKKETTNEENINRSIKKMSPSKNYRSEEKYVLNTSSLNNYNRPATPPRVPPSSSASNMNEIENEQGQERIDNHKFSKPKIPTTPRAANNNALYSSSQPSKILTTPKGKIINIDNKIKDENKNIEGNQNDSGADLLMYLATSPYVSSKTPYDRIPTTPSRNLESAESSLHKLDHDSAVRFSHIKPSISSPQSTFKQTSVLDISGNQASGVFTNSMLDSPTVFITNSPYQRKKKLTSSSQSNNNFNVLQIPTTPSRELRSSPNPNSYLLKTPNFIMGDYVHNIFSPSPKVNFSSSTLPSSSDKYLGSSNSNLTTSSRTVNEFTLSNTSNSRDNSDK
ncbi:hypothetical protein TPHA_0A00420 [Tetrapisispora phaffii CBS 4417]|uniref:Uncharacterized protein n=1 Tax=Tetrapisispora phaffii (strain ATCC 24235 / CBS 4417 / NBRC 1672 / NRRL Y-8282 / UCD 70-5) TaxID=1071381 RepID=G8BMJ9_TETPH|nr:hypothetical protein TPHA_0A00420 [Tetrapisispora phaffii CBS 4417]CCE61127.1 hypothetical protein TPHA_0A00420 [Tetrapisispora phaffii CBS 4417]